MKRIKCGTFNKEIQDSIPKGIREQMKADREKAEKEQENKVKNLSVDSVIKSVCTGCDGTGWNNSLGFFTPERICYKCGGEGKNDL